MSMHEEFTDSRMLLSFLDGELDPAQEEVLFQQLSGDASLRAEMQDHLAIRKAVQHDVEAFTPPAAATTAVFAGLGFTIPAATAEAATGIGASWFSNFGFPAASAMVAGLVSMVLLFSLRTETPPVVFEPAPPVPVEIVQVTPPPTIIIQTIAAPVASLMLPDEKLEVVSAAEIVPSRQLNEVELAGIASLSNSPEVPRYQWELDQYHLQPMIATQPRGVLISARNTSARSNPSPTVLSQNDPVIANLNLGLMYRLGDSHLVGIEIGHEAFSMQFSGIDNGHNVAYEQNPLAWWTTLAYQYSGGQIFVPTLRPYIQAQIGGAIELGPMARASAGIKFQPFSQVSFLLGAEGTVLMYRFQNNWFNSRKLGITYGMSYEF